MNDLSQWLICYHPDFSPLEIVPKLSGLLLPSQKRTFPSLGNASLRPSILGLRSRLAFGRLHIPGSGLPLQPRVQTERYN